MVRTTDLGTAASKLDMAGLWKDRVPRLKLRIYQLDRLLKWTYPALHAHFVKIELSPEVLTTQWFITLFAYTFPVQPTVLQLWDYIFLTGWEGLFRVALSLLGSL
ncbi:rab-GTPase-TBC domain-containing protein, partial [Ochromonadaceae sp. CCMP2298]